MRTQLVYACVHARARTRDRGGIGGRTETDFYVVVLVYCHVFALSFGDYNVNAMPSMLKRAEI